MLTAPRTPLDGSTAQQRARHNAPLGTPMVKSPADDDPSSDLLDVTRTAGAGSGGGAGEPKAVRWTNRKEDEFKQ